MAAGLTEPAVNTPSRRAALAWRVYDAIFSRLIDCGGDRDFDYYGRCTTFLLGCILNPSNDSDGRVTPIELRVESDGLNEESAADLSFYNLMCDVFQADDIAWKYVVALDVSGAPIPHKVEKIKRV